MDVNTNLIGTNTNFGDESTNSENTLLDPQANKLQAKETNDETRIDISDSNDATDLITPNEIPPVTVCHFIRPIFWILMCIYDFRNNVGLAFEYFENHRTAYGVFTLAFTMLQAISTVWISCMIPHPKLVVSNG